MAEADRRCLKCGWEWLGGPTCPQLHPKRRRKIPTIRPRLTLAVHPIDPERVRVYLAACAAKGYAPSGAGSGPLSADIAAVLSRLREQAGMSESLPLWVTETELEDAHA